MPITKIQILEKLNRDLAHEYTHMLFYLHHSTTVAGPQRLAYQDFLAKQAASEMQHVRAFSSLILGLGGIPQVRATDLVVLENAQGIIDQAIALESQVLENYIDRMQEAQELGGIEGKMIVLFLEQQFLDTKTDLDNLYRMR